MWKPRLREVNCSRSCIAQVSQFLWLLPLPAGSPQRCPSLPLKKSALVTAPQPHTTPCRCWKAGRDSNSPPELEYHTRMPPRPYRVYLKRCLSFFLIRASSLTTIQIWIYKGRVSKIHPNGRQYVMLKNRGKCHINTQHSGNRSIFVQDVS